ncbi:MAG: HAMP domain-containing sensor histidine kinase [Elusimicrobiota bacterium]
MKIRTQLVVALGGLAIFSFFVAGFVTIISSRAVLLAVLASQHKKQVQMYGTVSELALRHREMPVLWRYMRLLDSFPGVRYSYLEGDNGDIWAHTDRRLVNKPALEWKTSTAAAQALEHAARVEVGGKVKGTAHLGVIADFSGELTPIVRRSLLPPLIRYGAMALVLSMGLGIGLAFWLARPIRFMSEGARRVGKGDLSVELPITSSSELGDLSRNFNQMVYKLRELDELKDEFIANVSHDLRSPMTAIRASADYLLKMDKDRDKLQPQQKKVLNMILFNTMRLNVFVTNMLDAAKMKAGHMEYHLRPVRIEDVARNLSELYGGVLASRGLTFSVDVPEGTPAVLADPERFDQVLANLVSNALKFTPPGGLITVGARTAGDVVSVMVSDTGKGIAEKDLPKLFMRFEQVDVEDQRAKKVSGTGLGLFIVRETVEAMGGTIQVASQEGAGTCFTLTLAAARDA